MSDPDLSISDGNCLVYLSRQHVTSNRPLVCMPFEQLVYNKCLPLIEKVDTPDYFSSGAQSRPSDSSISQTKKQTCSLCLEAPQLYDTDAVRQYNITTRNFFAWIMNKPIVGPDPSSALLALKLRMDVWRTSNVNNMSDLYQYAKGQGYGDLGDMQLFLSNHLRGLSSSPAGYKLLAASEQALESEEEVLKLGFRKSIRKRLSSFVKRRPTLEASDANVETIDNVPVSVSQDESALMSGAISPSDRIDLLVPPLSHQLSADDSSKVRPQAIAKANLPSRIPVPNPRTNYAGRRTYSMPVLPRDSSIEDLARELEKQSLWIQNLTKEHFESATNRSTSSLPALGNFFSAPLTTSLPPVSSLPPQSPSRMASHRRRASLSRPPSPIQEEESTTIPDVSTSGPTVPEQSPRRFSTSAVTPGPAVSRRNDGDVEPVKPLSILKNPIQFHTKPPFSATEDNASASPNKCVHSLLPSHTRFPCKNCGKPKLDRKPLQTRPQSTISSPAAEARPYRLSLDLEGARDRLKTELPFEKDAKSSPMPVATLSDQVRALTRFPSLRRRSVSSASRARTSQTSSYISRPALPDQYTPVHSNIDRANMSMPNLGYHGEENTVLPATISQVQTTAPALSQQAPIPPTADPKLQAPRTSSDEAPEAISSVVSPPLLNTNPGSVVELSDSPGNSPTEAPSPVTPRTPVHPLMSKGLTSESKPTSPVARLKAQGGSGGLLSTILADPKTIDGHRVPLDEMTLSTHDTKIIDNMLADMISVSTLEDSPRWLRMSSDHNKSEQTSLIKGISAGEVLTPTLLKDNPSTKKKSVRNSLRLWTSRKAKQEQSIQPLTQYQANVLVLDSSGSFSTLVSPVEDTLYDWEKQLQDRSRTPLCELP